MLAGLAVRACLPDGDLAEQCRWHLQARLVYSGDPLDEVRRRPESLSSLRTEALHQRIAWGEEVLVAAQPSQYLHPPILV